MLYVTAQLCSAGTLRVWSARVKQFLKLFSLDFAINSIELESLEKALLAIICSLVDKLTMAYSIRYPGT